jgi:hypothetical protein
MNKSVMGIGNEGEEEGLGYIVGSITFTMR